MQPGVGDDCRGFDHRIATALQCERRRDLDRGRRPEVDTGGSRSSPKLASNDGSFGRTAGQPAHTNIRHPHDKADADKVKAQLREATVYRSCVLSSGKQVVSHAKFIIIDHAVLLLTSANFSFSAENRNVEFGLLIHDSALAESVEATMTNKHGSLYTVVGA